MHLVDSNTGFGSITANVFEDAFPRGPKLDQVSFAIRFFAFHACACVGSRPKINELINY
jgi:hypothetical protein